MKCNLEALMEAEGISQRAMASSLGIHHYKVGHWMMSGVPLEYCDDVCGLLDCTLDELYTIEPTEWEWEVA